MKHRNRARLLLEAVEGAVLLGAAYVTWPVSQRWLKNWGAESCEKTRDWLGDELADGPHETHTRAIHIDATAETVWAWLVQFGLGRAGFYSYELLERMAGIPVRNVESIEPSLQSLAVGDELVLHPKVPGIRVSLLKRGRWICFGVDPTVPGGDRSRSWAMYIEPTTAKCCRVILRSCITDPGVHGLSKRVTLALEQPLDFVMKQRMMRTIKRFAEAV